MSDASILAGLASDDPDVVLKALFELGGERDAVPCVDVFEAALSHLEDEDVDVRRQTAFAVGVHWSYLPALDRFIALLDVEKDDSVAETLLAAISRIARESPGHRRAALAALNRTFLKPRVSDLLRKQAHLEARRICGEITAAEYAVFAAQPPSATIDNQWWDRALADSEPYDSEGEP